MERHVRREQDKPILTVPAFADVNQLDGQCLRFVLADYLGFDGQEILGTATALTVHAVNLLRGEPCSLVTKTTQVLLDHCDGVKLQLPFEFHKCGRCRKPAVEEHIRNVAYDGLRAAHHLKRSCRCPAKRQLTALVPRSPLVEPLGFLKAVSFLLRGQKHGVNRKEAVAIAPSQCQETKPELVLVFAMVEDVAEQLDFLGTTSLVGRVVDDEDVDAVLARQSGEYTDEAYGEHSCETRPVDVLGVKEAIERVFRRSCDFAGLNGCEERFVGKNQKEEFILYSGPHVKDQKGAKKSLGQDSRNEALFIHATRGYPSR